MNKYIVAISLVTFSLSANANISTDQICKAGIATIMGKSPSIITINSTNDDVKYLSYIRKSDNSKWSYKCKIKGSRIHWGSVRNDGTEGRWRTHPADTKVSFKTEGKTITIIEGTYPKTYDIAEL
jgi:hypothetical protein